MSVILLLLALLLMAWVVFAIGPGWRCLMGHDWMLTYRNPCSGMVAELPDGCEFTPGDMEALGFAPVERSCFRCGKSELL